MKTIVILLSDKRSGSTMFQNILCKHNDIQTVQSSPHTYLETHHWLKGAVLLSKNRVLFSGSKTYKNYGSKKNTRTYIETLLKSNLPDYQIPKNDKQLVFEGWEALCDKFAKPIFFEKSPQHLAHWAALSLLLEWIKKTDKYKVKVVGLVRNPIAVQYSAFQLFKTLPNDRQYGWLNIHKNMLAFKSFLKEDQFELVKYEDIIEAPERKISELCDFIGISYHPSMINEVHGDSRHKWNENPSFNLKVDSSVKQMAYTLGYKPEELINTNNQKINYFNKVGWILNTLFIKSKNKIVNRFLKPIKLRISDLKIYFNSK